MEARELRPGLKCGLVVSRRIGGTVLGRDTLAMSADISIPIFDAEIEQRVSFAEALTMGKTSFEWSGGKGSAIAEIRRLTHELLDAFNE